MTELQLLAARLLEEKKVQAVLGYEEAAHGVRPVFIRSAAEVGHLVFNTRCVQNLAAYLNPRRKQITQLGKLAVVVKGCDARAVAGLIREQQITREQLVVIAMRCGGVMRRADEDAELSGENVSPRCAACADREPHLYDYVLGEMPAAPPVHQGMTQRIAELEAMSAEERRGFWNAELSRCIRCYACREACPMCFCVRCQAESEQPQWIPPSPTPAANRAWQMMRVLHHAGRCVECMECERVCPEEIPLGLLVRFVADAVEKRFDYRASDDAAVPAPLGVYRAEDGEEFIR